MPIQSKEKRIDGYWFGENWLRCNGLTISSHSLGSFSSENELIDAYDAAGASVGLVRVYDDGTHLELRAGPKFRETNNDAN